MRPGDRSHSASSLAVLAGAFGRRALTAYRGNNAPGVQPGDRLRTAAKRLTVGRAYHVGRNIWYLPADGTSSGMLKVHDGRIQEVGIADRRLARSRADARRFLRSFS